MTITQPSTTYTVRFGWQLVLLLGVLAVLRQFGSAPTRGGCLQ